MWRRRRRSDGRKRSNDAGYSGIERLRCDSFNVDG